MRVCELLWGCLVKRRLLAGGRSGLGIVAFLGLRRRRKWRILREIGSGSNGFPD